MLTYKPDVRLIMGTGSAIDVEVGYVPTLVELFIGNYQLHGFFHADMLPGGFAFTIVEEVRSGNIMLGLNKLMIGSSSDLALKTLLTQGVFIAAETTKVDIAGAETAFTATTHDITADKWTAFLLSAVTNGNKTITKAASSYDTEALALAAIPSLPALSVPLGIITVKAQSDTAWDASSASLAGGATNPAEETNYYPTGGIITGGITLKGNGSSDTYKGFRIGTNANINVAGIPIIAKCYR